MNNLLQPLTLKFVIRTLNDSAAKLKQDKLKSYLSRKRRRSPLLPGQLDGEPIRKGRQASGHKSFKSVGFVEDHHLGDEEDELTNARGTDRAGRSAQKRSIFQIGAKDDQPEPRKSSPPRHQSTDARAADPRARRQRSQALANKTESDNDCAPNESASDADYSHDFEE